jgi:hypothetical protein
VLNDGHSIRSNLPGFRKGAQDRPARDCHRSDLLARNPLLRLGSGNLGASTGPAAPELPAWLSEETSVRRLIQIREHGFGKPARLVAFAAHVDIFPA